MLSTPIKIYLQSSLSSSSEVFFTDETSHWPTGSSVKSVTSSHNAPGIYDVSDLLRFFQWLQYLMPHYSVVTLSAADFDTQML